MIHPGAVVLSATVMLTAATTIVAVEQERPQRTNRQICSELAYELDEAQREQLITDEQARELKAKCYRLFPST